MRGILLILILLVVAAIAVIATGLVNFNSVQPGRVPQVAAGENGVRVQGGEAPKFQVETGKVAVGTGQATVPVPRIEVRPPAGGSQAQPGQQPQQAPQAQQPAGGEVATTDSTQR